MPKLAFLFPGQGAQYVGMGKDFFEAFPIARHVFEEAGDVLSKNVEKFIFEGPISDLTQTRNSQVCIFIVSMAVLRTLQNQFPDLKPLICAGLSLGEYSALCASNKLSFKHSLQLIQKRADLMHQACETVPGTMAAVLGLDVKTVQDTVGPLVNENVWVANYNCPGQVVVSGTIKGVEIASIALKAAGAKRVMPLQVHGAFHSGLMQKAQDRLAKEIENCPLIDSNIDLVMNVTGTIEEDLEKIKKNMIEQVTNSVLWQQSIETMKEIPIDYYFEIGCGKTLTGMNKKMGLLSKTISLEKVVDLEKVSQILS